MKRFITILVLTLTAFMSSAQHRIVPVLDINHKTYEEAIELLNIMERSAFIEKMEGINLDCNLTSTSGGEIILQKDGNSINIMHGEFTKMIEESIANPHRRWYDIDSIRTELIIQNVAMFEYISMVLSENRHIKNMYIKMDPRTGVSYIRVNYYKL